MINCVIIDDEQPARDAMELLLQHYFAGEVSIAGKAGSLSEGVLLICRKKPDLVFLDIELQDENGFNIYKYFQTISFAIVFTTAYKDYAIEAVKDAALDYILKPITIEAIRETLTLFERKKSALATPEKIEKLITNLENHSYSSAKIALPTLYGFQVEKINSIIFCEADQNYTRLFTIDGGELMISKPLNTVQHLLPSELFFRIHKSYLVNLNYVKTYSRNEGFHVILENGKKLDVATRRNDEFVRAMTSR